MGPVGSRRRPLIFLIAVPLLAVSWGLMWTQKSYWNPLFFLGTWVAAALVMYGSTPSGYPGWRRHVALSALSVPLWWWFEAVNARVDNWEYVTLYDYGKVPYALLASLAFSTVVPAIDSASRITLGLLRPPPVHRDSVGRRVHLVEVLAGLGAVGLTFTVPDLFFPLVWVGPFLLLDGVVGYGGGRSIANDLYRRQWLPVMSIGLAGLMCGALWEFWNFWSMPKWIYHVPYLDYIHVFEMPILGYGGYIPFAWSVYQLTQVGPVRRYLDSLV